MADVPNDPIELNVDKFIFRFPQDLKYTESGLWVRREGDRLRLGLSDFFQQRSGDIAFATLMQPGTKLEVDDEIASIETVKVNLSLPSPVKGTILEVNSTLQDAPELINQDPYGGGWICILQPEDPESSLVKLLDAGAYLETARNQAEAELAS